MSDEIPLGQKESLHLELKSREALKRPEIIGREVVAMLNADGGEVWIGLRDENDRAVGLEPIPEAEQERRRLRDYLMDTLEPAPSGDEVEVQVVHAEKGADLLRVVMRPKQERRPYAHLKEGSGRHFVIRVGDRMRPMSREELLENLTHSASTLESALERAMGELLARREQAQTAGRASFWLALRPAMDIQIALRDRALADSLQDPRLTGNRLAGWNFSRFESVVPNKEGLLADDGWRRVEIGRDGGLTFQAALESLYWKGGAREIWPYILLEYPVSAFRLARKIYDGKLHPDDRVAADLALIGLHGWTLRGGSPGRVPALNLPSSPFAEDDFLLERPLLFTSAEIESEPDRCGYRLVERVYGAFGFRPDAIPREFDRKTGRLVFPE